ncbi:hypothetical protein [Streptomyces sp. NPDC054838]
MRAVHRDRHGDLGQVLVAGQVEDRRLEREGAQALGEQRAPVGVQDPPLDDGEPGEALPVGGVLRRGGLERAELLIGDDRGQDLLRPTGGLCGIRHRKVSARRAAARAVEPLVLPEEKADLQ